RMVSAAIIDTLADLHAIDVSTGALSGLGKPAGFVERQVLGWSDRWHRSQTVPLPEMDALAEWLRDHLPGDPAVPSVVHGDFKLAVVIQQIYFRYVSGQTTDERFASFGARVTYLARHAAARTMLA